MRRQKASPALDKAVAALRSAVARHSAAGAAHLPSFGELCRSTGVCRITLARALRRLEAQGVVQVVPRRGVRIVGPVPPPAPSPPAPQEERLPPRWRQVADAINEGILSGVYARGEELPSSKELARIHASCHAVVRRSLASLAGRNVLERCGRGYRVCQSRASRARSRIIFAAATADPVALSTLTNQAAELWRSVERECDRRNLVLELRTLEDCVHASGQLTSGPGPVLGCIVWTVAPGPAAVADAARAASRAGLPVAILDGLGLDDASWTGSWSPGVRAFPVTSSEEPGYRMGMHLTRLGHRRLAFVMLAGSDVVGQRRLTGLRRALVDTGLPSDIVVTTPPHRVTSQEAIEASEPFRRWLDALQAGAGRFCRDVGAVPDGTTPLRFAWDYGRARLTAVELEPAFASLAAHRELSAWVCYNDTMALAALDFCRRRRIAVPQRLSVAGFDDTVEAFGRGLTSHNFNGPAAVSAMFEHLLKGRRAGRPTGRPLSYEVPGMVMERASTGPAAR